MVLRSLAGMSLVRVFIYIASISFNLPFDLHAMQVFAISVDRRM